MSNQGSRLRVDWARLVPRYAFILFFSNSSLWVCRVLVTRFECTLGADWVMFHDTARLVLSSRWGEIYPGVTPRYPFFYPPYFLPFVVPLGWFSRSWAYVLVVLAMAGAMTASFSALRLVLPAKTPSYATGVLVVLSSASWSVMFVAGQLSASYLLILVLGLVLWSRNSRLAAGAVLSLMMFKPNLGLVFPPIFLARRQWALLAGWTAAFLLLVTTTFPLGVGIWIDYLGSFRTLADTVAGRIPMWKQQTIYAFWRTALGAPGAPKVLTLWALSALPLGVVTAAAWLKAPLDSRHLPRLFGITVLALVCCNTYLFLYDGLLLALPGMVWYMQRDHYRSATCHRIGGAALLFVYVWQHLTTWVLQGGWALVGPAVGVWLIAEAWDLIGASRAPLTAMSGRFLDREGLADQDVLSNGGKPSRGDETIRRDPLNQALPEIDPS